MDNAPRESQRPGGDFYNRAVHTMNGGDDPSRHFQSMGSGGGYSDNTPPNANQNYYNGTYGVSASPGNNNNNGSGGAPGQQYSGGSGGFGNQVSLSLRFMFKGLLPYTVGLFHVEWCIRQL